MTKTLAPWTVLDSKVLLEHPRLKVVEDKVRLPMGQLTDYIRIEGRGAAVTIICIRNRQVLLQREYSYPVGEFLLQFPGGKMEGTETPEEAGSRELQEESGYAFSSCQHLGWFYVDNRRSDAKMHVLLATDVTPVEKAGGDLEEEIETFWLPINLFGEMIARGEITNYSVLAAFALLAKNKLSVL
jgi:8-oxo-dGTP pyrophosphatase MutT (NUDIX family)